MTMSDIHSLVRERAKAAPYGWQAALAKRLELTPAYISDTITGKRAISNAHLHIYLDALGLELTVKRRDE